jgi:fumarate hydratase class II
MMPVMASAMLESIEVLGGACNAFRTRCVDGIEADRERCRELLERNPSIATALNPLIGYDRASQIAKESAKSKRSVRSVAREAGISEADLDACLNVRDMTEPGIPGTDA